MRGDQRVVLITSSGDLRAAVMRLVALAGVSAEVVTASGAARSAWRTAVAVVVGADLAAALAATALPRRANVVVVATCEADSDLWRVAVELGATRLLVLPAEEEALVELLGEATEPVGSPAAVVGVVGGCGGSGASTLAAAVALTGARSGRTLLVDADRLSGGVDVLLGVEHQVGARWPELVRARGRIDAATLAAALVSLESLEVLSWGRGEAAAASADAASAVLDAGVRGFSLIVVDLPRCLDEAAAVFAAAAALVVMVVPARVQAAAAATAVAAEFAGRCDRLELVVRDPGVNGLNSAEVGSALQLATVATLRSEGSVVQAALRGEPPLRRDRGALAECSRSVLGALSVGLAA
jgi:secretion/DNA translocation related CpaE-like protein